MTHDATLAVERWSQARDRRIAGAGIGGAINRHPLPEDRERSKPEGRLVRRELCQLTARAIAIGILRLNAVDDAGRENGALDGDALIADGAWAGIEYSRLVDRIGRNARLRHRCPSGKARREQCDGAAGAKTSGCRHEASNAHVECTPRMLVMDGAGGGSAYFRR